MSVLPFAFFQSGLAVGPTLKEIPFSMGISGPDTPATNTYLTDTASAGDRQKFTVAFWANVAEASWNATNILFFTGWTATNNFFSIGANNDEQLYIQYAIGAGTQNVATNARLRDPTGFYHIVVAVDTTQAVAADRIKVYVNGTTRNTSGAYPSQNELLAVNNAGATHSIATGPNTTVTWDGIIADYYFIDGQQLTADDFGVIESGTGQFRPITYTGSYGTNGAYLDFSDFSAASNIGLDSSGNGNNYTVNGAQRSNVYLWQQRRHTPTQLYMQRMSSIPRTNGAVQESRYGDAEWVFASGPGTSAWIGSFGIPDGKWYWELRVSQLGSTLFFGVYSTTAIGSGGVGPSYEYLSTGLKRTDLSATSAYGASYTTNDVIGVALDVTNSQITFYKNNVSQGTLTFTSPLTPGQVRLYAVQALSASQIRGFALMGASTNNADGTTYAPPTGFTPLSFTSASSDLPTATSGTYTGNGNTDGPYVYLNAVPDTVTVAGTPVVWGTDAIRTTNGFKIITTSATFNTASSSYSYTATLLCNQAKLPNAQLAIP